MKKIRFILIMLLTLIMAFSLAACGGTVAPPDGGGGTDSPGGGDDPKFDAKTNYGTAAIFDEEIGFFNASPSVFEESGTRYVYYMANETKNDAVASVMLKMGTKAGDKWTYGERKKVLSKSATGWDSGEISSPDVVKGTFGYNSETYSYLMAYQGTVTADKCYSIGFAVAKTPDGEWVKVGTNAALRYNPDVFGDFTGFTSPSLINRDKTSSIQLFYSASNAYGAFPAFTDIDCSQMSEIPPSSEGLLPLGGAIISTSGLIDGGASVIFGNGDFALDSVSEKIYLVRDVFPLAGTAPLSATKVELSSIAADEIYKIENESEWLSIKTLSSMDTDVDGDAELNIGWERIYAATIVCDQYGIIDSAAKVEFIYTASATPEQTDKYIFTPSLHSFVASLEV